MWIADEHDCSEAVRGIGLGFIPELGRNMCQLLFGCVGVVMAVAGWRDTAQLPADAEGVDLDQG
ncbi:hypothetical protein [Nocardioides sambongensis]|uniref:hypothetical protein n=1 Tax=Nocardioides sambongensis TaxID=2589074 RepID=UPI0011294183|nr:hypothetical protein [Nocardioides sambongensis]